MELAKLFSVLDIRVVKEIHISIKLIANKISCQMLIQNDVKPIVLMVFSLHKKDKRSCELVNRYGCHSRDQFSKRLFIRTL